MELLYIEDDEVLAEVTNKALKARGFRVTYCKSLSEFKNTDLTLLEFAVLDLKLDDGNSISIIPDLVEKFPGIKILVLTGYASIATAVKAVKLGALNYLAKPATVDQICNALEGREESGESTESEQNDEIDQPSMKRIEWEHIQRVLDENHGNISATARQLKMHRRTLQRKLQKKPVSK